MSDLEAVRRQAEENHRRNQQTQMATEQQISSSTLREAYNAQLSWVRNQSDNKS